MAYEGLVKYISELDELWPTKDDPRSQGDDHIRTLKTALKGQFTGLASESPGRKVTVNSAELNMLAGINTTQTLDARFNDVNNCMSKLQQRIENAEFNITKLYENLCAIHPERPDCINIPTPPNPHPGDCDL